MRKGVSAHAQAHIPLRQLAQPCKPWHLDLHGGVINTVAILYAQAMIYSGINGVGLALVVPCVQSLIADYTAADKRGAAFGVLYFTGALGKRPLAFSP